MCHVALWQLVEALDNKVPDAVQSELLIEEGRLTARATAWFLRSPRLAEPMEHTFTRFMPAVEALRDRLASDAAASPKAATWTAVGVPAPLAWRIASAEGLYDALDVAEVAENVQRSVAEVAEVHAEVADRLGIARLRQQIDALPADSHWQSLAKGALADDLGGLQRSITQAVMAAGEAAGPHCSPPGKRPMRARGAGHSASWPTLAKPKPQTWRCCRSRCASYGTWPSAVLCVPETDAPVDAYRAGEASIWTMPSSCGLIGRFRLWPEGNFCRNQRW